MQSKALRIAVVSSLALSIAVMIFPTVVLYAKASIFVRRVFNLEAVVSKVSVSQNAGDADININIRPVDPSADGQTLRPDILPSAPQSAARFLAAVWNPTIVGGERKVTMPHLLREWITPLRHSDFSEQCRLCAGFPRDDAQACTMTSAELHPCPRLFSCRDCLYDLTRLTGKGLNDFTIETELFFGSRIPSSMAPWTRRSTPGASRRACRAMSASNARGTRQGPSGTTARRPIRCAVSVSSSLAG